MSNYRDELRRALELARSSPSSGLEALRKSPTLRGRVVPGAGALARHAGALAMGLGLFEEAADMFTIAIELGEQVGWVLVGRSNCFLALHRLEEARVDLDMAEQIASESADEDLAELIAGARDRFRASS